MKLKKLERINDEALVKFWESAALLDECEAVLNATREKLELQIARDEYEKAKSNMTKARLEYLRAKVAKERT